MRYSLPQRLLHWLIAVMGIGALIGGSTIGFLGFQGMTETFGEDLRNLIYKYHKTFGVLILGFMVIRVIVKLRTPRPEYAVPLTPFERAASGAAHGLLYLCFLAMPALGWLATGASGFPVEFFNWTLPPILGRDKKLGETLFFLHEIVGYLTIALVLGHIGAALRHQFVKKDGLLGRMT